MRELVAITRNITLVKDEKWSGQAEIVIITSEPQYHLDEDSELKIRRRECEAFRFLANETQINTLIEGLEKLRFQLQSTEVAVNFANEEKKAA